MMRRQALDEYQAAGEHATRRLPMHMRIRCICVWRHVHARCIPVCMSPIHHTHVVLRCTCLIVCAYVRTRCISGPGYNLCTHTLYSRPEICICAYACAHTLYIRMETCTHTICIDTHVVFLHTRCIHTHVVFQAPGVRETCDFEAMHQSYYSQLFPVNPSGIVPTAPAVALDQPHGRGEAGAAAIFHCREPRE